MATTMTPENAERVFKKYGGVVVKPVSPLDGGLALGIYGPGGIGKTTLAATITNSVLGSPALLLNARGNPHVVSSYSDRVHVIDLVDFAHQERVRQDILRDKSFEYRSIIIDNVTELFHMDLRVRYGPLVHVSWEMHSATTEVVLQLVRNWVDLAATGPRVNVVFVFQEAPEARTIRGRKVDSRSEIAFNKALQSQIPTIINFLGRLYVVTDTPPYTRLLDFRPIETQQQSKMQTDPQDELAGSIPLEQYNPSLASLLDTLVGRQPWPVAKHAKPARVVDA